MEINTKQKATQPPTGSQQQQQNANNNNNKEGASEVTLEVGWACDHTHTPTCACPCTFTMHHEAHPVNRLSAPLVGCWGCWLLVVDVIVIVVPLP
jgi:hypothetical protein